MSNRIKIKRNSTADFDSATLPSSLPTINLLEHCHANSVTDSTLFAKMT